MAAIILKNLDKNSNLIDNEVKMDAFILQIQFVNQKIAENKYIPLFYQTASATSCEDGMPLLMDTITSIRVSHLRLLANNTILKTDITDSLFIYDTYNTKSAITIKDFITAINPQKFISAYNSSYSPDEVRLQSTKNLDLRGRCRFAVEIIKNRTQKLTDTTNYITIQ
jgi:hypothetical protein